MSWQRITDKVQQDLLDSIPSKWRLPSNFDVSAESRVDTFIEERKLLSSRQLLLTSMDVSELASEIRSGNFTAFEVVEAFCARAAYAHQLTNCLMSFFPEEALEQAMRLDNDFKISRKVIGPLHGVPVAIKDTFHVKGKPSTLGYVALHDNVADDDATIVQSLREAGAIIHCKTTMPQTGMALETASNLFGRTLNPFNTAHGAGGSSGGDGALIAMRGAPVAPMTDIGGSIRAPAAFNGLYAIRPTADRIPKTGFESWNPGQMSIRVSSGPACHSVRDLKLVTPILNYGKREAPNPSCAPVSWVEQPLPSGKLHFAVLCSDGVVTPHPPVRRSLTEAISQIRAAGHHVTEIELPFSAWEIAQSTFKLYFQSGAAEAKAMIARTDEPTLPAFQHYLDVFQIKGLSITEVFELNREMIANKKIFQDTWNSLANEAGQQLDGIICPSAPSLTIPHDFPIWWGYTSIWNYLDYPSTVIPLKTQKVKPELDLQQPEHPPLQGSANFDKMNYDMYDPSIFKNSPFSIQIVTRPYEDEKLLNITEVVDAVVNSQGLEPEA